MKLRATLRGIPARLRTRMLVGLALGTFAFSAATMGLAHMANPEGHGGASTGPLDLGYMGWTSFSLFILSPCAWQWTGDDRPSVPFPRGLLQSLIIVAAELGCYLLLAAILRLPGREDVPWVLMLTLSTAQYAFAGSLITAWEQRKARKTAAQERAREAQWTLLQSQMSPHALLNALNGLAQLVQEDLEAGRQGIRDLAAIYRQLVEHGSRPAVSLASERELVQRFLAVEQLRLGNRLAVSWDWDPCLEQLEVPPLLLQPLVENALKHGVSTSPEGGHVTITLARRPGGLLLGVANTGQPLGPARLEGIGLRNLAARLDLAFGARARLELSSEGPWTQAHIHLTGAFPCP